MGEALGNVRQWNAGEKMDLGFEKPIHSICPFGPGLNRPLPPLTTNTIAVQDTCDKAERYLDPYMPGR